MKNNQVLKLLFAVGSANQTNDVIIFDVTNPLRPSPLLIKNNLNGEFFDLLASAPILYQSLHSNTTMLNLIRDSLEPAAKTADEKNVVKAIDSLINANLMAMRTATEGAEVVLKEISAENLSKFGKL